MSLYHKGFTLISFFLIFFFLPFFEFPFLSLMLSLTPSLPPLYILPFPGRNEWVMVSSADCVSCGIWIESVNILC